MKTSLGYIMPYQAESGNAKYMDVGGDKLKDFLCKSHEESIASIDALLNKRKSSIREIIEETGEAKEKVIEYVVDKIDQGMAIIDGFKNVNGIDEAQLKLF